MNIPEAKKSLGQHWLYDRTSLEAMADSANVRASDLVLEVGPGTGSLTEVLLGKGVNIVAVELDRDRIPELKKRFAGKPLQIFEKSILQFDLSQLPPGYKLVANIPYYLTSHLIRMLSESLNPPKIASLLVQKEVAERVAAKPGDMSLLSVSAQFYWEVSTGQVVEAKLFTPPPKVDSQILILKRRLHPLFEVDEKVFFRLVKAGYSNRRKKINNSLAAGLRISKPATQELLQTANLNSEARPQEFSLEDWYDLYQAFTAQK